MPAIEAIWNCCSDLAQGERKGDLVEMHKQLTVTLGNGGGPNSVGIITFGPFRVSPQPFHKQVLTFSLGFDPSATAAGDPSTWKYWKMVLAGVITKDAETGVPLFEFPQWGGLVSPYDFGDVGGLARFYGAEAFDIWGQTRDFTDLYFRSDLMLRTIQGREVLVDNPTLDPINNPFQISRLINPITYPPGHCFEFGRDYTIEIRISDFRTLFDESATWPDPYNGKTRTQYYYDAGYVHASTLFVDFETVPI